jgi:glycosyltransferase involved in cell wall biosynthesis
LKAFKILIIKYNNITLHLVGKDYRDNYLKDLNSFIHRNQLGEKVFYYGEQQDVTSFLLTMDIGILSSSSEGLPVALLEYGRARLPVVCTRVGECAELVGKAGKVVSPEDPVSLAEAIRLYLEDETKRKRDASEFHQKIKQKFSEEAIMPEVLSFYQSLNIQ